MLLSKPGEFQSCVQQDRFPSVTCPLSALHCSLEIHLSFKITSRPAEMHWFHERTHISLRALSVTFKLVILWCRGGHGTVIEFARIVLYHLWYFYFCPREQHASKTHAVYLKTLCSWDLMLFTQRYKTLFLLILVCVILLNYTIDEIWSVPRPQLKSDFRRCGTWIIRTSFMVLLDRMNVLCIKWLKVLFQRI